MIYIIVMLEYLRESEIVHKKCNRVLSDLYMYLEIIFVIFRLFIWLN